ncbi:hypothetical protein D8674_013896 [Pyrus ussuriensis x Pyrus communis]|uniref:Uncharacterized protein n=1 Tax=Pyrus ussuriensis x Pyrus communis TaxID=2448454 RepID=A0A5N5GS91_9ROSA|nr:hypothetical protein D8674_013896 [Pyrus ussuriensis x Pyrus communis]
MKRNRRGNIDIDVASIYRRRPSIHNELVLDLAVVAPSQRRRLYSGSERRKTLCRLESGLVSSEVVLKQAFQNMGSLRRLPPRPLAHPSLLPDRLLQLLPSLHLHLLPSRRLPLRRDQFPHRRLESDSLIMALRDSSPNTSKIGQLAEDAKALALGTTGVSFTPVCCQTDEAGHGICTPAHIVFPEPRKFSTRYGLFNGFTSTWFEESWI